MFRSAYRTIVLVLQVLMIATPLLGRWRRQKLSFLLKEGAFLVLTNWDLIWKYLEKRKWSIETAKDLLKLIRFKR
jgi:hypothetical protein